MRITGLIFSLLLAMPVLSRAQSICNLRLSGVVNDECTGGPLEYAHIYIAETGQGTITDSTGKYVVEGLCPGRYTVRVSHLGCETREVAVDLTADLRRDFLLEHHLEELGQVTVSGDFGHVATTQTIERIDADILSRNRNHTLAEALENLPGLYVVRTGPNIAKPVLHGLSGSRLALVGAGVKQEGQQWGTEHAPVVNAFILPDIRVIKGAAGVRYGSDAVGGLITMMPGPVPIQAGLSGQVGAGAASNGRSGSLQVGLEAGIPRLEKSGWRVRATALRSGDRKAPDYYLNNTGIREIAASFDWGIRRLAWGTEIHIGQYHEKKGILRGADFGTVVGPENDAPFSYAIGAPQQSVMHYTGRASGYYRFDRVGKLTASYAYQKSIRKEFDVRRGDLKEVPIMNLDLRTHDGEMVVDQHARGRLRGQFGVQAQYQFNYNVPNTGVNPLIPNYKRYRAGAFAVQRLQYGSSEVEFGFRYDYQFMRVKRIPAGSTSVETTRHDYHQVAGSIGFNTDINGWLAVSTHLGTGFRPPGVNELFSDGLHHGSRIFEEGDPGLGSETSVKWVGTLTLTPFDGRLEATLTGYFNFIYNYIYLTPTGDTILALSGLFPKFRYGQTNAVISGLDADLRLALWRGISLKGQVSLVRGNDGPAGDPLIYMPADRFRLGWSYQPEAGERKAGFQAGMTWEWVSRQRRFVPGLDFQDPPPAYHRMDAHVAVNIRLEQDRQLRFGLSADNLYNTDFRDYLDFFRYYASSSGWNLSGHLEFKF